MRVAYIGNHVPPFSTENHVTQALRANGHRVVPFQENTPATWMKGAIVKEEPDVVMWTRTWHLPEFPQGELLRDLKAAEIPTVAYHLDRWWGLPREHQVAEEPMFQCDLVVTADGGHPERWAELGIDHVWFPPAVSAAETLRVGRPVPKVFREPLVFVGSWERYHPEWQHRQELIRWLKETYGPRFGIWPRDSRGVRGQPLADLYATAKVAVGDSCMLGPSHNYWSDRIPETLGRGAYLIHPNTPGLDDHYEPGKHLGTWDVGDWDALKAAIDWALDPAHAADVQLIREAGQAHVRATATYEVRMEQLVAVLKDRGML